MKNLTTVDLFFNVNSWLRYSSRVFSSGFFVAPCTDTLYANQTCVMCHIMCLYADLPVIFLMLTHRRVYMYENLHDIGAVASTTGVIS